MVDLQFLLAPVAADDPCGPDLGDDLAMLELERLAAGVAEQRMGWSVRPGQPPDWAKVAAGASALLGRSKDWRVALLLARAWLHLERWQGLEPGLALLLGLWSRYGREVHPQPGANHPGGWLGTFDGDEADGRPRLLRHPLLTDLGALRLGNGDDVITVAEIERLQEQRLLDVPGAFDPAPVHRALDAELAAVPELESMLAAALSRLDELADAIGGAEIRLSAPHQLVARLRLRVGRVTDALRSRHGPADGVVATPSPELDENTSALSTEHLATPLLPLRGRSMPGTPIPPLSIERLASALSPDDPCGPNLEYDPAHIELMQLAEWIPERQYGDFIEPARPPDWAGIYWHALELSRRTRDLRVAVLLARAAAATKGWSGAIEGLQLVDTLIERWWHAVHPMLDAEDNDDATMRVNSLAPLAAENGLLGELRRIEFGDDTSVVYAGDIERLLAGRTSSAGLPGGAAAQLGHIVRGQLEREPGLGDRLRELLALVDRLSAAVQARTPYYDPLSALSQFVRTLQRLVDEVASGRWLTQSATEPPPAEKEEDSAPAAPPSHLPPFSVLPDAATNAAARELIARITTWLEAAPR
jgi:type VI secretion system ImpA family protein